MTVHRRFDSTQGLHPIITLQSVGRDLSHAPFPPLMTDNPTLGSCPKCNESLSTGYLLVEYEKDDGTTGIWAECPDCDEVVSPQ